MPVNFPLTSQGNNIVKTNWALFSLLNDKTSCSAERGNPQAFFHEFRHISFNSTTIVSKICHNSEGKRNVFSIKVFNIYVFASLFDPSLSPPPPPLLWLSQTGPLVPHVLPIEPLLVIFAYGLSKKNSRQKN